MDSPPIVFTDLDGTLLDARTYSPAAARDAVRALTRRGIPVVFCSSKTAAEQRPLRVELELEDVPFIVENGSAIFVPARAGLKTGDDCTWSEQGDEKVCVLGLPVAVVRERIARVAAVGGVVLTGYADLELTRLVGLTALDPAAAARAQQRDFSETLVDAHAARVWSELEPVFAAAGLVCRHGGRFHTVTGATADKGRAVRMVAALYAEKRSAGVRTVAMGDSANDATMLAAVDCAYLVAREDGTWAESDLPNLHRIARPGPQGWSQAVAEMLERS